jgi:hypothetical protein
MPRFGRMLVFFMSAALVVLVGNAWERRQRDEIDDGVFLRLDEGHAQSSRSFRFELRHDGTAVLETVTGERDTWTVPPDAREQAERALADHGFATMKPEYTGRSTPTSSRMGLTVDGGSIRKTVVADDADPESAACWDVAARLRQIFFLEPVRDRLWERWVARQATSARGR